jgi:membrane protein
MVLQMRSFFQWIRLFFVRAYYILKHSVIAFIDNNDYLKASALTFYTLISIVPVLAVAFGIAKGFGFEQYLEKELREVFNDQKEVIGYAMQFAMTLLQNAQGGVIAGVGLITLLWTNLSMLGNIENALNDIWKVRQPRAFTKKLSDYLAAMIICPIVLVVSSSLSVYLSTQITESVKENPYLEVMSPYLFFLLRLLPFILSSLLFIVIYLFIPNVKIRTAPRVWAGILAGIAFQFWQWVYITFQVKISNYGAVYGTFAALPLFLIWVQVSWLIVLAGAELAAHLENELSCTEYKSPDLIRKASQNELGLLILNRCIQAYSKGEPAPTSLEIAQNLGISLMTAQQMIYLLEEGGVLTEVDLKGDSACGYQPRKDARLFTVKGICDTIEKQLGWVVSVEKSETLEHIADCVQEINQAAETSQANINMEMLQNIVAQKVLETEPEY